MVQKLKKYATAFEHLQKLIPATPHNPAMQDAIIHDYLISHGTKEQQRLSYRAVIEHMKLEFKSNSNDLSEATYINIFYKHNWTKHKLERWRTFGCR